MVKPRHLEGKNLANWHEFTNISEYFHPPNISRVRYSASSNELTIGDSANDSFDNECVTSDSAIVREEQQLDSERTVNDKVNYTNNF